MVRAILLLVNIILLIAKLTIKIIKAVTKN